MAYISDSIRLLGLVVTTKPFSFVDNILTCDYSTHVDVNDILTIKQNLQSRLDDSNRIYTDEERRALSDDIYFLDKIIQELQKAGT